MESQSEIINALDILPGNAENIAYLAEQIRSPGGIIPFRRVRLFDAGRISQLDPISQERWPPGRTRTTEIDQFLRQGATEEAEYALLETLGDRHFQDLLEHTFSPVATKLSGPVMSLPKLTGGPVVTINLDSVLEAVFLQAGRPFERVVDGTALDMVQWVFHQRRPALIKVYGSATGGNENRQTS